MSDPDATLRELRSLFRDELEDALAPLAAARAALAGADATARRAGLDEAFRVVHSLKGAARAVGWAGVERFCHALESRLGAAREGAAPAARAASDVAHAADALRDCLAALDARGAPDDDALARALRGLDAPPPEAPPAPSSAPPREVSSSTPPASEAPAPAATAETARVSTARLDALVGAAEELAAAAGRLDDRGHLDALEAALLDARSAARRGAHDDVARSLAAALALVSDRRRAAVAERRAADVAGADVLRLARRMRVKPAGAVAPALERAVAEAAMSLGREADFAFEGASVELDRRVLEGLREPLLHLVRNAVDHGVESPAARVRVGKPSRGLVRVVVAAAGTSVTFTVSDDGAGVDPAAARAAAKARGLQLDDGRDPLQILFEPGVTTRRDVTELSGRGVGLDVVRQRVARLHGHVSFASEPGRGASVAMTVPVDLSVTRALFARAGDALVALVTNAVVRVRRVGPDDERPVGGARHLVDEGGALVPLAELAEALGVPSAGARRGGARRPCVVVAAGDRRAAFLVDELGEEREVVARALPRRVRRAPFVAATALRDDGEVALVLDPGDLVGLSAPAREAPPAPRAARRGVLVADDSVTTRQLLRSILEAAGYAVTVASDGLAAWGLLAGESRFDALVTDVEMPRMDGWQLLARVRGEARTAKLPVVVVTALARPAEQERALAFGASAYVVKGRFDQAELLEALDQLTG